MAWLKYSRASRASFLAWPAPHRVSGINSLLRDVFLDIKDASFARRLLTLSSSCMFWRVVWCGVRVPRLVDFRVCYFSCLSKFLSIFPQWVDVSLAGRVARFVSPCLARPDSSLGLIAHCRDGLWL